MRFVVQVILGAGASHELVECGHLGGYFFYLGRDNTDGFIMDGFGRVLDFYIAFSDSLHHEISLSGRRIGLRLSECTFQSACILVLSTSFLSLTSLAMSS